MSHPGGVKEDRGGTYQKGHNKWAILKEVNSQGLIETLILGVGEAQQRRIGS